jgi:bacterioferritin (cytochrome b1)
MSDYNYFGEPDFQPSEQPPSMEELAASCDFLLTLKKIAAGDPSGWSDPLTAPAGQEPAEAAPPEGEAPADPAAAAPAPAAAQMAPEPPADPLAGIRLALAATIAHELRSNLAYNFYAETIRGPGRAEMAEIFKEFAISEMEDAKYLLRRMSVMFPGGGVLVPPSPSPEPLEDPQQILELLHGLELEAQSKLMYLHTAVGDDPMKFTLEQMMTDEQHHADVLQQLMMPAAPAPSTIPDSTVDVPPPVAEAAPEPPVEEPSAPIEQKTADLETEREAMMAAANEPVSNYLVRTQNEDLLRHKSELEHTRRELEQSQAAAQQSAVALEQAQAQAQQTAEQTAQIQAQAQEATATADAAQAQAVQASEQAAAEAVAKMNLSMRISQMRQQLATLAAADPVAEEGLSTGAVAGPTTPTQQAMAQQEAAMAMDPTGGTGQAPTQGAAEQQQEAATAQQDAQEQTAQAQQKTTEDTAKAEGGGSAKPPGTNVTVKTSANVTIKAAGVSPAFGSELLAMASRGRKLMPVSHVVPTAPGIGAIQNLIGHRPPPVPVSAVRNASTLEGARSVIQGARATPAELGQALRTKTKVQGAQQLASALPLGPTPAGLQGLINTKLAGRRRR